jgi:hypothetical protein
MFTFILLSASKQFFGSCKLISLAMSVSPTVLKDMHRLEQDGKFVVNGLSDVRKGLKGETTPEGDPSNAVYSRSDQGFDVKYDRSVCPAPWWQQSLSLVDDSGVDFECYNATDQDAATLHSIQLKVQRLRRELADILDRPTILDSSLGHVS